VDEMIGEWLAYLSHRWPSITWETVQVMPIEWLCYYIRAAKAIIEAEERAMRER
jgi:hypothetical protein